MAEPTNVYVQVPFNIDRWKQCIMNGNVILTVVKEENNFVSSKIFSSKDYQDCVTIYIDRRNNVREKQLKFSARSEKWFKVR